MEVQFPEYLRKKVLQLLDYNRREIEKVWLLQLNEYLHIVTQEPERSKIDAYSRLDVRSVMNYSLS